MTAVLTAPQILPGSDEISLEDACEAARRIGAGHGRNAASWCFDGNTPAETYRIVARGLADIDPLVINAFDANVPALCADYDARALCDDIDVDHDATDPGEVEVIADAWRDAASVAFWAELDRIVACHLA